jgi:excisionase family DNA binding protein
MEFLTTQQAAKRLGISDVRVRQLVREGRLPATLFGRVFMIREADLKAVGHRKPGRPRKGAGQKAAKKSSKKS